MILALLIGLGILISIILVSGLFFYLAFKTEWFFYVLVVVLFLLLAWMAGDYFISYNKFGFFR